ncbi:TPA: hypothetical protein ACH3X3_003523 [Trebouxia sp. C0006]
MSKLRVAEVPRAVGRFGRPRWDALPAPRRPTEARRSPSTLRRAGVSRGVRICCTLRSTPGSCDVHRISPVSRSRQDADAGMPASAPASTLCSLGIPASKRRKSSAQRPALRCRARTSADREQRLSSASTSMYGRLTFHRMPTHYRGRRRPTGRDAYRTPVGRDVTTTGRDAHWM